MINKESIKEIYHKNNLDFYFSLAGPFIMGTIHLVSVLMHFDWIALNYCLFAYLMLLFKVWQWAIEKYGFKPKAYIAGILSIIVILAPMMASFVLTILYQDAPHYILDWFIYVYALYGTIKMTNAIIKISKKETKTERMFVNTWLGLVNALYTIQMMEFKLITTFEEGGTDQSMMYMQWFSQGAIFLFTLFVLSLFIKKTINQNKNK